MCNSIPSQHKGIIINCSFCTLMLVRSTAISSILLQQQVKAGFTLTLQNNLTPMIKVDVAFVKDPELKASKLQIVCAIGSQTRVGGFRKWNKQLCPSRIPHIAVFHRKAWKVQCTAMQLHMIARLTGSLTKIGTCYISMRNTTKEFISFIQGCNWYQNERYAHNIKLWKLPSRAAQPHLVRMKA